MGTPFGLPTADLSFLPLDAYFTIYRCSRLSIWVGWLFVCIQRHILCNNKMYSVCVLYKSWLCALLFTSEYLSDVLVSVWILSCECSLSYIALSNPWFEPIGIKLMPMCHVGFEWDFHKDLGHSQRLQTFTNNSSLTLAMCKLPSYVCKSTELVVLRDSVYSQIGGIHWDWVLCEWPHSPFSHMLPVQSHVCKWMILGDVQRLGTFTETGDIHKYPKVWHKTRSVNLG